MRFNRKTVAVITAPDAIVALSEMKLALRVDGNDDNALIERYIEVATDQVKQYTRRSLGEETLELTMDGFNAVDDDALVRLGPGVHTGSHSHLTGKGNEIDLPFPPIMEIVSIKTFDRGNNESTFDANRYQLDQTGGRIYLNEGEVWPDNLRLREAVKVRYKAGYDTVPAIFIQAIYDLVSNMYDCREVCEMCDKWKKTLAPYKLWDDLGYR